jgi:exonuclease SbcD
VRIVHVSDTHLGFGAYTKLDPSEGFNQREADIYDAFRQAVDKAIELKPDVLVHAGDLFDTIRPQNRAIDFALRQLLRLSEAGIPTVLISGNHSTPRLRETGNIFRIFEHLEGIYPVHGPGVQRVVVGDMSLLAIPHSTNPPLADIVASAKPSTETSRNVLVLHAGMVGTKTYKMDEFNEQAVPVAAVPSEFDYVALGHYHRMTRIRDRMYYSGSTERLGFGEVGQDKGVLEVDLGSGRTEFHKLDIRDMLELEPIDASSLSSSDIAREAKHRLSAADIGDRIVRMVVDNVAGDAYRALDVPAIRRMGSSALHFELKLVRKEEESVAGGGEVTIGSLGDEFRKYVASRDLRDEKKRMLIDLGMPYLAEDEE